MKIRPEGLSNLGVLQARLPGASFRRNEKSRKELRNPKEVVPSRRETRGALREMPNEGRRQQPTGSGVGGLGSPELGSDSVVTWTPVALQHPIFPQTALLSPLRTPGSVILS